MTSPASSPRIPATSACTRAILDTAQAIAAEVGRPVAQVALACVIARPGVASTLIGASKPEQLTGNLAAADLLLDPEQLSRLNKASAPPPGFTAGLAAPAVRRMVFGGNTVTGWGEGRGGDVG